MLKNDSVSAILSVLLKIAKEFKDDATDLHTNIVRLIEDGRLRDDGNRVPFGELEGESIHVPESLFDAVKNLLRKWGHPVD